MPSKISHIFAVSSQNDVATLTYKENAKRISQSGNASFSCTPKSLAISPQGIIRDGLPHRLAGGEHLPVNLRALFDCICQSKGRIKVRPGGEQALLEPNNCLIGLQEVQS